MIAFRPREVLLFSHVQGWTGKKKVLCLFLLPQLRAQFIIKQLHSQKNVISVRLISSFPTFFFFGKGQKRNYRTRQDWDKRNIDRRFTLGVNCKQGLCLAAMFFLLLCLHRALKEITLQSHQAAFPNFILSLQASGIVTRGRRRCTRCLSSRPQRLADCVVSQQKHAVCFMSASVF